MKDNRLLNWLGLAWRARGLVTGDDAVMQAIRTKEAKLVLLAEDTGANARKKYEDKCKFYGIPLLVTQTKADIGIAIGKSNRSVVAITNQGITEKIEARAREIIGGDVLE